MTSIQRQIQPLKPQIGLHSKTDSTIKDSNRIQCKSIQRQIQPLMVESVFEWNSH